MGFVTIIWLSMASASATLALMHLLIWFKERSQQKNLIFALTAISAACFIVVELAMMHASTPAQYSKLMRWIHVPLTGMSIMIGCFAYLHLNGGRPWLLWSSCATRLLATAVNFVQPENLNYRSVSQVSQVRLFGENLSLARGETNPLVIIGQLSLLLLIAFIVDAAVSCWRAGDRHRAAVGGGSMALFAIAGSVQSMLTFWGVAEIPLAVSVWYLAMLVVVSYELSQDMLRAAQLARDLQESISARRISEAETARLREHLSHAGRVSMMGQLASSLAHELNQPLSAILRNAEAAELYLQSTSPDLEELRAIIADIRRDDQRAGDVINRLRGLLKRRDLQVGPVSVRELLDEVILLSHSDATSRRIKFEIDASPSLPMVVGDRIQLQQVLLNLVLNAMDAVGECPVERRAIRVAADVNRGDLMEISVTDRGHGIAPERMNQLFDPFFTTKTNGLGMGLLISRTIVEAHEGKIWAENRPEGGAIFRFTLPTVAVPAMSLLEGQPA